MPRIALAQINAKVGDIGGNLNKILNYISSAKDSGVDILCFPELSITGYPPEDLLLKPNFINDSISTIEEIRKASSNITVIVGFPDKKEDIY
ncbi:MAG: nitrilase-related carbon-nitrogen hydrolase, partial [Thermodesulfobacteriota bacterium]